MVYQEIINSFAQRCPRQIESWSIEEQDNLFELIRKRRIEQRRAEIAAVARDTLQAVETGKAKSFTNFEDLKSYLLADDE